MRIKIDINLKVGRVVKYFIICDLIFWGGWGIVQPIFAVFVLENIAGATVVTVGVLAAIFWTVKSVLQIPLARYLDKTPGEKDDFYALISGLFLASISAFLFVLAKDVWQLYLIEILHSAALALYVVSWTPIFSRHLDGDKVSFDWALDSSAVGIAAGLTGFFGGVIAKFFGFEAVFVLVALFSAASAMVLLLVPDLILPRGERRVDVPPTVKSRLPMGH